MRSQEKGKTGNRTRTVFTNQGRTLKREDVKDPVTREDKRKSHIEGTEDKDGKLQSDVF